MSAENENKKSSEEKLKSFIEQKTSENQALKKLLNELNKDLQSDSIKNIPKKK